MKKHKIINVKGPEKQENEIPNSLFICFTCVVFVSGLDFGFSKTLKKNVQILLNSYRRFLSTLFITAIFIQIVYKIKNAQLTASYWLIYGLIQYILHVIFIHLSTYNLYYFFIDMNSVGTYYTKVNKNEHNSMVNLFIIAFWISCISKGVFCYLFCTSEMDECKTLYIPGYIYCDIIIGLDVITLVQILIYYYIYKAAKYLNVALEEKGIKWARKHFTAIADICDKITPIYGRLVIVQILSNLPRALETMWSMFYFIKYDATFFSILPRILLTMHLISQLFIPPVIIEMASTQIETLKSLLDSRLVQENDHEKNQEIMRFLQYIKARPLHRKVWRIIPVDAKLITSLLSLFTTYFIVIIQFSHLYD